MDESTMNGLAETMERLCAAVAQLEAAVGRMDEQRTAIAASAEESVGRIVATVETAREVELERKLQAAEARIEELMAAGSLAVGRKTLAGGTMALLSKQGVTMEAGATMDGPSLDAALTSLSIEQRIAVKGELMRAGLLR